MNKIWNNMELEQIKLFLKSWNLEIDNENKIKKIEKINTENKYIKLHKNINLLPELERIFNYNDKNDIYRILNLTKPIKIFVLRNSNNHSCLGLLSTLSKIDTNNAAEIFTIFNEILTQYLRTSYNLVEIIAKKYNNNIDLLKAKTEAISNCQIETNEEKSIKNYMTKILGYTNGIAEEEIFKSLIEKCNVNIKNRLLFDLNRKIDSITKSNKNIIDSDYYNYLNNTIVRKARRINRKKI